LGVGASAQVFAAEEPATRRRVAVKILHPNLRGDAVWSARFLREGRALARVRNPHVATLLDVGWTDDARPFLVMERVDGPSLEDLLVQRGPEAPRKVVEELLQICEALAAVHAAGIVHRDLKLSNVLVGQDARGEMQLKVVDFGIARNPQEVKGPSLTPVQGILGTPHYIAPEQARDPRNVDARADLWALGVCAYRLLTGRYPFPGESAGQVLVKVLEAAPVPLRSLRPDVPEALEGVVHRCLAREPSARYADARAVAVALALADSDNLATRRDAPVKVVRRKRGPPFALVAALITALFLGLGGLTGWLLRR
jgi:serine/threonine-protein kinase